MLKYSDYFADLLASIQSLQDMFSKNFNIYLCIYNQNFKATTVFSNSSFFCSSSCLENKSFCSKMIETKIISTNGLNKSFYFTCPNMLTLAVVPLLENNRTSNTENYYLVIGKIPIKKERFPFLEEEEIENIDSQGMDISEFHKIVDIISSTFKVLFNLIDFSNPDVLEKGSTKVVENHLLTKREIEIVRLVSIGLSNQEIATQLYISEHTVKTHISNILKKLEINNRTKLALFEFQSL